MSLRWLSGTMLTGLAGSALVGGALHAALDGPALLREPVRATVGVTASARAAPARKGDRPLVALAPAPPRERILHVPTVTRLGPSQVIRKKPFALASAPLGIAAPASYAPFDPLAVFSASATNAVAGMASIYGADIESPVTTRRSPFPADGPFGDRPISMPAAALAVMAARPALDRGAAQVAALPFLSPARPQDASTAHVPSAKDAPANDAPADASVDPGIDPGDPFALFDRQSGASPPSLGAPPLTTALMLEAENVSRVERIGSAPGSGPGALDAPMAREEVLTISARTALVPRLRAALTAYGADPELAAALGRAAAQGLDGADEATVRVAYHARPDEAEATGPSPNARPNAGGAAGARSPNDRSVRRNRSVRRISVYRGRNHVASLARTDSGAIVSAPAPVPVRAAFEWDRDERARLSASMPTLYDGIMRAALSQGLSERQGQRLVRLMAFDLDFRARAQPTDRLEVFYEAPEPGGDADTHGADDKTEVSRILYAAVTVGERTRRYYRLVGADGAVAFFDENGRSPNKFLLRKPVPNGRFTSGYGMRRHPKLRYRKMHTGVDWAARSGTPILASGRGVVIRARRAGGYGRQIKIRHNNGYVTSYSHLRRYARGIRPGKVVEQGQVIGQVGSSGLSTGPHLHYEVIVNGRHVDPMRIRVPRQNTLTGPRLAAFERERDRIDALVRRARGDGERLAGK